jgi:hypothetical protein
VTGTVAVANGGTNSTATPTSGGIGYGTGTAHAYSAAGTTGQVLTSNGSSAPTWATASYGKLLQVVSTTKTNTFSTASTSYVDITGLSVSITPSSSSSKIYVVVSISGSESAGFGYQLVRGSTAICIGDSGGGSRKQASGGMSVRDTNGVNNGIINYLDSPATTSSTTYKIQMYVPSSTGYINRTYGDVDASYTIRSASTITVMEIAA